MLRQLILIMLVSVICAQNCTVTELLKCNNELATCMELCYVPSQECAMCMATLMDNCYGCLRG